jgi:hypothetical protein
MPYGSMESRPSQQAQVRIGDAERDRAVAALGDHFAAGRLTNEEFEQRMEQAIKARFNEDLEPLFADLPQTWNRTQRRRRIVGPTSTSHGQPCCGWHRSLCSSR